MVREEKSDYPFKAVREVLVNALIHRNYQIIGTEIHVDIFDDRMEIMSPGGMMSGSRIQNMNKEHIPSMRRNEKISDIFGRLGFMDRRGSGIQRILNSYKNYSQEPTFYSDENIFLVTMPNRSFTGAKRVQKIPPQYTGKVTLANKSKGQIAEKSSLMKEVSGQTDEKVTLANKSKGQIAEKSSLTKKVVGQTDEKVTLANKVSGQTAEKSALANKVSGQTAEKSALANKVSGQTAEKSSLTNKVSDQTVEKSALANKVSGQTAEK
ncbi:ATP-binding protein, partial [Lactobacillus delbrueckii]|uniref:ATP-binding protein n=1 Tax=Lactobacillus delbrueckii TaxID=1584 RepID=UPI002FD9BBF7